LIAWVPRRAIPINGKVASERTAALSEFWIQGKGCAMGLFKKKVMKEIDGGAWGHLVSIHQVSVDTLSKEMRCVEREGVLDGGRPVTFLRIFRPGEAQEKNIVITGWETFDQHPDLILFEGYVTRANEAYLERKR
jgi:hypothetical protein